jgi:hypothetical protein
MVTGIMGTSPVSPVLNTPIEPFAMPQSVVENGGGDGGARSIAVGNNSDDSALLQEQLTQRKLLEFVTQGKEKDLTIMQINDANSGKAIENPFDEKYFKNVQNMYSSTIKEADVTPFELELWVSKMMHKQLELMNSEKLEKLKKSMKSEDSSVLLGAEYFPLMPGSINQNTTFSRNGRKLLDMYGDSLKFANSLFNSAFGSAPRKVPAHMPHMIDRDTVQELMDKYASQKKLLFSNF